MKIILTGSTGLIGGGVLRRCIAHPEITSIVALTRRPIDVESPKLNNIINKDFLKYDEAVVEQMKGAEACIWVLGSPMSGKDVHVNYTKAAIDVLLTSIVPQQATGKPFRFVYTSGGLMPYLDSSALFFLGPARKMRGDVDREVLALEKEHPGRWESFVIRPWFVGAPDAETPPWISRISSAWIYNEELAAAMVDAALNGNKERIIPNAELRLKGQAALKLQK